jgi:AcrR family transcriptional regulator
MARARGRSPQERPEGARPVRRGRRARGDVRALVIKAATRLFAARGFDGTTLQAVADEVKVRKPSVLHHFGSKEALHAGVIEDMMAHWSRVIPQLIHGATQRRNPFVEIMRELTGFFLEDPDRARLLNREVVDHPAEFRALFRTHIQPWIAMFAGGVRDGQKRGVYRADVDPEQYLVHMLQLIVISIGHADVLTDPAAEDAREQEERRQRELLRISRASLLVDARRPRAPAGPRRTPGHG